MVAGDLGHIFGDAVGSSVLTIRFTAGRAAKGSKPVNVKLGRKCRLFLSEVGGVELGF
jgi:hypothetical protein